MIIWDPNFGELAIREIWENDERVNAEIFFLKNLSNPPSPRGLQIISVIDYYSSIGHSQIHHGLLTLDFVRTTEEQLTKTRRVKRRVASNEDIHDLLNIWNRKSHLWPDEWIFNIRKVYVDEMKLISEKEFYRLNDITSQYIKIGNPLNKLQR